MRFIVVTLFPDIFTGYLNQSILHRAIQRGLVSVELVNLRDWSDDPHHRVDDRPFGGGPGMVIRVEPVVACVEAIRQRLDQPARLILLTPQGRRLTQPIVQQLADEPTLILLCGRYEGFDHRVVEILRPDEISLGDFVLGGGEVAAMAIMDSVVRLIPDVLGDERSSQEDSFSFGVGGLEAEHYTRPREFRGLTVPEVLLSGNHQEIQGWRETRSRIRTQDRRPDLNAS